VGKGEVYGSDGHMSKTLNVEAFFARHFQ